jgi:hypothetical protein
MVGVVREKIMKTKNGEWATIRYDEQQFWPELFKEILPFAFTGATRWWR